MAEPMSDELAGAVAIVTGAAGGVGRATVELLAARGARVVAEDLNPAVDELEGEQVVALNGDVAEPDTARRAVALAHERFGALNVVVNNAGRFLLKPTVDTSDDDWDELLRVNVRGAFLHCRDEVMAGVPDREATLASIASEHPLGRLARAEEIAEVIAFLASPRSSIITGAILMADGGFTAQ
jgi:NAD(P)-dependent dehydrogenase (short-subunit alcohol dehydrogenase family)